MTVMEENQSTWRQTWSVTLCPTNPTWTGCGWNQDFCSVRLAINQLPEPLNGH